MLTAAYACPNTVTHMHSPLERNESQLPCLKRERVSKEEQINLFNKNIHFLKTVENKLK